MGREEEEVKAVWFTGAAAEALRAKAVKAFTMASRAGWNDAVAMAAAMEVLLAAAPEMPVSEAYVQTEAWIEDARRHRLSVDRAPSPSLGERGDGSLAYVLSPKSS
jgi:hypothetical protein